MGKVDYLVTNPVIVLREEFDDWALLFDPDSNVAFGVNPVGVLIWKQLDSKHNLGDIVSALRENCDDVSDNVETDVENFLNSLILTGFAGRIKN